MAEGWQRRPLWPGPRDGGLSLLLTCWRRGVAGIQEDWWWLWNVLGRQVQGGKCWPTQTEKTAKQNQWMPQARPTAKLLQKGLMQLKTKSHAQCHPSCIFSVVCGCGQSRVEIDWFMACWGGMPGLHSQRLLRYGQKMKTHAISSWQGTARLLDFPPSLSPPPPSTLSPPMETYSQKMIWWLLMRT